MTIGILYDNALDDKTSIKYLAIVLIIEMS